MIHSVAVTDGPKKETLTGKRSNFSVPDVRVY